MRHTITVPSDVYEKLKEVSKVENTPMQTILEQCFWASIEDRMSSESNSDMASALQLLPSNRRDYVYKILSARGYFNKLLLLIWEVKLDLNTLEHLIWLWGFYELEDKKDPVSFLESLLRFHKDEVQDNA